MCLHCAQVLFVRFVYLFILSQIYNKQILLLCSCVVCIIVHVALIFYTKETMNLPYVETNMFKMLQALTASGDLSISEFSVDPAYLMAGGNKRTIRETVKRLIDRECVKKIGDRYRIEPKAKDYVEDVLEMKTQKPLENLVGSPYRNVWTPEISGYTKSLYANKRGY